LNFVSTEFVIGIDCEFAVKNRTSSLEFIVIKPPLATARAA